MLVILNEHIIAEKHPISGWVQRLYNQVNNQVSLQVEYEADGKTIKTYEDNEGNFYDRDKMSIQLKEMPFMNDSIHIKPNRSYYDELDAEGEYSFEFSHDSMLVKLFEDKGGEGFEITNADTWNQDAVKLFREMYFFYNNTFLEVTCFSRFVGGSKFTFMAKPKTLLCL